LTKCMIMVNDLDIVNKILTISEYLVTVLYAKNIYLIYNPNRSKS